MTPMPVRWRRPGPEAVATQLRAQREASVTYAPVGVTRRDDTPRGFRDDRWSVRLGEGDETFARARAGLAAWAVHRGAGLQVTPQDAALTPGETVVLVVPLLGLHVVAACRVGWTVDEPDATGFAYGTLPGHPERGEESFVVRREPGGGVVFEMRAVSRPGHPLVRLGAPVARLLQRRATRRYLAAMQAWVRSPPE